MEYSVSVAALKGKCHKSNEDAYFIGGDYLIIADGMGGECNGDIASGIAVKTISEVFEESLADADTGEDVRSLSFEAIRQADSKISEYINRNPESDGMGTTVIIAVRKDDRLYVSWCGDSRCYAYNNGSLRSITKDHSYVQELIDAGEISEEQSFSHPDNNLITRYVGGGPGSCVPDFLFYDMSGSDIFVFCSDGLSGYCNNDAISELMAYNTRPDKLSDQLLDLALRHGSDDDITILALYPDAHDSRHPFLGWLKRMIKLNV